MVAESIVCMRKLMLSMMAPCAQDGMTALVHANHLRMTGMRKPKLMLLMCDNLCAQDGMTALMLANREWHFGVVQALWNAGAKKDIKGPVGVMVGLAGKGGDEGNEVDCWWCFTCLRDLRTMMFSGSLLTCRRLARYHSAWPNLKWASLSRIHLGRSAGVCSGCQGVAVRDEWSRSCSARWAVAPVG